MFGGFGPDGVPQSDTWEWDGKVWKELRSDDGPSGRDHHAMVYGDTWVCDGQRWTEIPVDGPSRRYVYSMSYEAYELDRKRALFFGGGHRESDRWVLFDETWLWNGSQWQKPDRQ